MSATHLLDSDALIALLVTNHEHHPRASSWAAEVDRLAICPVVEGALTRFLVRVGEHPSTAVALLRALLASGRCDFWADDVSYSTVDLGHVIGHRQVTDAYLAGLAAAHDGTLATFDEALSAALPDRVLLIP